MSNFSAVLVGINKYKNSPLRGCCTDVIIMRDILVKKYGVPASKIRLVLDDRATKDNIMERLEWLSTNDTEHKFFHFSGHGAQIPVQDYKNNYEPDGMDEIICPYDFNWNGRYITDNQIDDILSKMKAEHHMTMVFDSCHSGTMDRSVGADADVRSRMIETPLDLLSRLSDVTLSEGILGVDLDELFKVEKQPKVIKNNPKFSSHNVSIITGCKESQTSADAFMANRYQGALSYTMQGLLMMDSDITLKDLRDQCEQRLKRQRFTQTPQLLCNEENLNKPFIQI